MSGVDWSAMAEELRRALSTEAPVPAVEDECIIRSSVHFQRGRSVFLLVQQGEETSLLGVVRFAKDLPGIFPGERLPLAKCGAAVAAELDHASAGALKSLLQLAPPSHLKGGGSEKVLLCCGGELEKCEEETAETVRRAGLTPCWIGGSADGAFWNAFAAGWHEAYYWCRSLAKWQEGETANEALTKAYGGRIFVLNDGSALRMPEQIGGSLPEELKSCEAVEADSAASLLILDREVKKAGGTLGLAVLKENGEEVEKECRAVAASGGIGRLAVAPERFAALRRAGGCEYGCDLKDDSLATAAKKIKNMV